MENIFRKEYSVRAYEIDYQAKAQPLTVLNYLQDIAGEHAARLGVSVTDLLKQNLTWVLSRYHVRIIRYPVFGETIRIETWPSGARGIFALRDFEMQDKDENVILKATSSWILLGLKDKKPIRLADYRSDFPLVDRRAVQDDFSTLPVPEKVDLELPFRVRMSDLDLNSHVNHTFYIQWALETVPPEILRRKRPVDIEVGFKAEAFYGDRVISRTQKSDSSEKPEFIHQLRNEKDGSELTRLRTIWR